ncbi:MAG TPA: DUF1223 domain-containing protein [Novimethylophilus sp.]|jgi:hypothetical protein|uniref:DUF1223 domain-containing protein n=1 Tax=Novimethylophilus sp. TaxID=2137426 RepID=UPI002F3EB358
MSRLLNSQLAVVLALSMATPAWAGACSVGSGPVRAALLELYTSEGCSSCPPADRWLGRLAAQGFSANRVVPLALHVDYWDYIGWQDRFAKPAFTARQREQAAIGFVYTPQVMLNGQDFRGWGSAARFEETVAAINRTAPRADIRLSLNQAPGKLEADIVVQLAKQEDAAVYLALYENDLSTQVKAGENSGTTLHHDYVVREWLGPYAANGKHIRQTIALKPGWKAKDSGIVAFVQNRGSGEILQALASKLCE